MLVYWLSWGSNEINTHVKSLVKKNLTHRKTIQHIIDKNLGVHIARFELCCSPSGMMGDDKSIVSFSEFSDFSSIGLLWEAEQHNMVKRTNSGAVWPGQESCAPLP